MKSVFADHVELNENDKNAKGKTPASGVLCPPEFDDLARKFVQTIRENLSDNEVRALAADKVACPVLVVRREVYAFMCISRDTIRLTICPASARNGVGPGKLQRGWLTYGLCLGGTDFCV